MAWLGSGDDVFVTRAVSGCRGAVIGGTPHHRSMVLRIFTALLGAAWLLCPGGADAQPGKSPEEREVREEAEEAQRAMDVFLREQKVLIRRGELWAELDSFYSTDSREEFIGSGTLFWEEEADGRQTPTDASLGGVATDPSIQVVALVDGGTASASEIVAGALQDSGRAALIGQTTFGKGTIQQWQELTGEGGAFRLTIAKWLTPVKRWIHDVGIAPDVVVEVPATTQGDDDPILDRALEVLTGGGAIRAVGPVVA